MITRSKKKQEDAEANNQQKISSNRREGKKSLKKIEEASDEASASKKQMARRYYHCCLTNSKTGKQCNTPRIEDINIWRHIESKMHLGKKQPKDKGLPAAIVRCHGNDC